MGSEREELESKGTYIKSKQPVWFTVRNGGFFVAGHSFYLFDRHLFTMETLVWLWSVLKLFPNHVF